MTFTYDAAQLATSELCQVRLEIDDVDSNNFKFQDEEITYFLSRERNIWGAAAHAAEILSRKYFGQADVVQLGRNLRIEYAKRAQQYADVAKALRAKSNATVLPFVGGTSISEKIDARDDTDAVQPLFTKRMQENPRIGGLSSDPVTDQTIP